MSKSRARNHPNSQQRGKFGGRRSRPDKPTGPNGAGWLWGHHAVEGALANPNRRLKRLVASRAAMSRLGPAGKTAEDLSPAEIGDLLPPGAVHQGLAAQFEALSDVALEDLIAADTPRLAVLDQVSDPHNLGAIFRSAAAFGFGGLVLQTRNAPPITGIVAKSAAGAIETVAECRVVNISRALDTLNAAGYHTVGLAGSGRANIRQALSGAAKVAIALGAEGPGLRPGVAKACAELAHIPIDPAMESLNVSNAAAIAFYEAREAH
ncbi:MAG: RNA methyltransferase [Henriciella sp.]|nr:RNA methyltransferase [Henriciella sp.]